MWRKKLWWVSKRHQKQTSKKANSSRDSKDNNGKLNILEYVVICAIMLISEAVDGNKVTITDIKKLYDKIISFIEVQNIPLPLIRRSQNMLASGFKKACNVRKTIG
jgi:hypothetical protein